MRFSEYCHVYGFYYFANRLGNLYEGYRLAQNQNGGEAHVHMCRRGTGDGKITVAF